MAYEPVWAIGTGKNATAEEAGEAHAHIRARLREWFGARGRRGLPDPVRRLGQARQHPGAHRPAGRRRRPGGRSQPGRAELLRNHQPVGLRLGACPARPGARGASGAGILSRYAATTSSSPCSSSSAHCCSWSCCCSRARAATSRRLSAAPSSQTAFGARSGATVLTRATTVLGTLFLVGAFVLSLMGPDVWRRVRGERRGGAGRQRPAGRAGAADAGDAGTGREQCGAGEQRAGAEFRPEREPESDAGDAGAGQVVDDRAAGRRIVLSPLSRKWRNWQTHQLEGLAVAIPWEFESPLPHHIYLRALSLRTPLHTLSRGPQSPAPLRGRRRLVAPALGAQGFAPQTPYTLTRGGPKAPLRSCGAVAWSLRHSAPRASPPRHPSMLTRGSPRAPLRSACCRRSAAPALGAPDYPRKTCSLCQANASGFRPPLPAAPARPRRDRAADSDERPLLKCSLSCPLTSSRWSGVTVM